MPHYRFGKGGRLLEVETAPPKSTAQKALETVERERSSRKYREDRTITTSDARFLFGGPNARQRKMPPKEEQEAEKEYHRERDTDPGERDPQEGGLPVTAPGGEPAPYPGSDGKPDTVHGDTVSTEEDPQNIDTEDTDAIMDKTAEEWEAEALSPEEAKKPLQPDEPNAQSQTPFICDTCGMKFGSARGLRVHSTTKHRE